MIRDTKWVALFGVLAIAAVALSFGLLAKTMGPSPSSASARLASLSPVAVSTVAPFLQATSTQPKINWTPTSSVEVILSPGESMAKDWTFTSDQAIQTAVVEPVPELAGLLSIQPNTIASLPAGQSQPVRISITIPTGTAFGTYSGTIHVRIGTQTLPQTVKVVVNVWQRLVSQTLGFSFTYPPDWIAEPPAAPQDGGIQVKPRTDDIGDAGITITRQSGSLADNVSGLNSQMLLLTDRTLEVNGVTWRILAHREFETGVEFITALTERNAFVYYVSAKNYPLSVFVISRLLQTVLFL